MEKIAIVEDDALLNRALTIALQKEGFAVLSAFNYQNGRICCCLILACLMATA